MLTVSTAGAASTQPRPLPKWRAAGVGDALKELERESGHKLDVAGNPQTGTPSTLGGLRSRLAGRDVPAWLHAHAKLFGVADTDGLLSKITGRVQMPDPTGAHHVWYRQTVHGVPVYNARLGVHLDRGNTTVTAVTNGLRPDLVLPASTIPTVRQKDALAVAGKTMRHAKPTASPTLVVYPGSAKQGYRSPSALAWQIDLTDKGGFSERIFVDALHKGVVAGVQSLTETAAAAVPDPPGHCRRTPPTMTSSGHRTSTTTRTAATTSRQSVRTAPSLRVSTTTTRPPRPTAVTSPIWTTPTRTPGNGATSVGVSTFTTTTSRRTWRPTTATLEGTPMTGSTSRSG